MSLITYEFTKAVLYLDDFDLRIRASFSSYDSSSYKPGYLTLYFRNTLTTDEQNQVAIFVNNYIDPTTFSSLVENYTLTMTTGPMNITTLSNDTLITIYQFIYSYRLSKLKTIKLLIQLTGTWSVGNGVVIRIWDRVQNRAVVNTTTYITTDNVSGTTPVVTLTAINVPFYDSVWQVQVRNTVTTMLVNLLSIQLLYFSV